MPEMSNITEGKKVPAADADLEYVVLCQKGDTEAFAMLVKKYSKKMLNIAYRMLGDYDDACDITQEAFWSAFRAIRSFKAEAAFSTWLYRIAVNAAKNRLRQRGNQLRQESPLSDEKREESGGCEICAADPQGAHPEQMMECRERDAAVQKCINGLEGEYREVVVMRDIQGFSYEEIRDILRIPDGTVKSRLSRARLALKDCLKKVIGDI